ncbi:transcriptional regulator, LysR family [Cribrihabitans marinus]|uniref:Transcriptional regulator, LysR family n=1 Tax=Cribrihabitans marinus TaxID=1227549 RepID=A0A1H6Z8C2_9RHOB|nr:LysR substrate-binding domain-containing protein [Cribrihabitans marinus]GGH31467.1 LysR family transcriptional regulator [Cribrihabitans marinus]SEJ47677.1 transcriptional regulator, LysR family [Cribrihabitans marinus]
MAIRFRQLQAFHAIYESGTVTGAALVLGISQPGVSNLISQLEREAKFKLFARVRGRLIPTPEAGVLYREVDTVVRGLDHVGQAITDLQNKQGGQLQVASQHALSFGFMPRLIAQFAENRPDMSISFQSQYSSKIQEWVVAGLFEIGVCEAPLLYDELDAHPFSLEMVVALHPENPLTRHSVLTPEVLAGEPLIAMGPDHMSHRRTREAFDTAGVPWTVRVHSHLFKNVLSFVQEGMGVAILDPLLLQHEKAGGFVTRPFRPRIMMDNIVVTSRDRPMSALGRAFLEVLLEEIEKSCS